ncbi:MAG: PQQ-dependent sugar dehydrogenase [Gemmatimonadota bacterium]
MRMLRLTAATAVLLLGAGPILAQETGDPFPEPIGQGGDAVTVDVVEFASIPDVDGEPARMHKMTHEPGTDRLFLNDQRGTIYIVGEDGSVTEYVDVDAPEWGVSVDASWREMGVQSFAFHPEFSEEGSDGYGKLYVWTDTDVTDPEPDFPGRGEEVAHHTVLLEFTASDAGAEAYDGVAPRELARFEQPFANHNGGDIAFNPLAEPGDADYGLLYVGNGDGGSGGDPLDLAQDLTSGFGKILRIDPLGSDGRTGEYGIPDDNPFAGDDAALDEIYAYGLRNPQHLAWDAATGQMFAADIGQNTVEEVSPVSAGADLGWNDWEGSFRFVGRSGVSVDDPRGDPDVTYPVAEYDQEDELLIGNSAVTGLEIYRQDAVPALNGRLLFGDLPSGEIFHVDADELPDGGQEALGRVLLRHEGGEARTLLELVQEKNREQEREVAERVDLRMAAGPDGRIFLLNKHDGTLRAIVSGG